MERRLAAVLAADIVGYSRLMGADEEGTLAALRQLKGDTHRAGGRASPGANRQVHGRRVPGPRFPMRLRRCPPANRSRAKSRSGTRPSRRKDGIRHRIGINRGEVVFEDDDIYGDTVNIAARLEGLAPPEGLAISESVFEALSDAQGQGFEDLGLQALKNIRSPVRVYRSATLRDHKEADAPASHARETASHPAAGVLLHETGKPSIAVLPFQNMSGDMEQDYFADGVTEELITALAHVRTLFVIARNSTFAYKNQTPDIREVGRDLGARYVLEGSVRKAGNRLRVTAQLIDAGTGTHVWADRYDRVLEDIFALQDEISQTLAARIEPRTGLPPSVSAPGAVPPPISGLGILPTRDVASLSIHAR